MAHLTGECPIFLVRRPLRKLVQPSDQFLSYLGHVGKALEKDGRIRDDGHAKTSLRWVRYSNCRHAFAVNAVDQLCRSRLLRMLPRDEEYDRTGLHVASWQEGAVRPEGCKVLAYRICLAYPARGNTDLLTRAPIKNPI